MQNYLRLVTKRSSSVRKKFYPFSLVTLRVLPLLVVVLASSSMILTHQAASAHHWLSTNTAVLNYKNDDSRSGQYTNETILNTSNVNVAQFGKRMAYPIDGGARAQPLYMPNLTINGRLHNVVFVATENDSVYAFDADQANPAYTVPLWHTSFTNPPAVTAVSSDFVQCGDLAPQIGITGTPVIDPNTNTMYLVTDTDENGTLVERLHALDIATGHDRPDSPVKITASVPGAGADSVNGMISFDASQHMQRPGLLLLHGIVYAAWGSYCDNPAYHGWIMGYNASTLKQVSVYNASINGNASAIWQSGAGIAADADGNIYVATGNGDFNLNSGGSDAGDTLLKLSTQNGLSVSDYFTPFNQSCLNATDGDFGSGGVTLLPRQNGAVPNELTLVGKEGRVYLVNRDNLGKYNTVANPCNNQNLTNVDHIVQELPPHTAKGGVWGLPATWSGSNGTSVYIGGVGDHIKAFNLANGLLSTTFTSETPEYYDYPGANPVISSKGMASGTGILWTIDPKAVLRAYDATDLSKELYSSDQNAGDNLGSYVKFTVPVIAHGRVFVGTQNSLVIYGLRQPPAYNNAGTSDDSDPAAGHFDGINSYSAQALLLVGITPGAQGSFNGVSFTWPSPTSGENNNYLARGQVLPVFPVSGATRLAFLGAATGGASSGTATITYTDGTTQNFTLGLSDWTLAMGTAPPSFGNQVVVTMPYRNTPNGPQIDRPSVFYTDVALLAGKTIGSVTLPSTTTGGQLHVFAISTK